MTCKLNARFFFYLFYFIIYYRLSFIKIVDLKKKKTYAYI